MQNYILKPIQNCRGYDADKNLVFKCDLDRGPTLTYVSNGTSTSDGEQLCQIILKSIHNCKVMVLTNWDAHKHPPMHAHKPNCHCDNYDPLFL